MKNTVQEKFSALSRILKVISKGSGKMVIYSTALLGMAALIPGFLPASVGATALIGVGVNSIAILLSNVTNNRISDEEIIQQVERIVAESGIDKLLTKDEFNSAINQLDEKLIQQINKIFDERGMDKLLTKEDFDRSLSQLIVEIQQIFDPGKQKESKPSSKSIRRFPQNTVTPYSLLPFGKQKEKLMEDLKQFIKGKNGKILLAPKLDYPLYHVVLPIRSEKYVFKLIILSKYTRDAIWENIKTNWTYEHAILFIVMDSVSSQLLPMSPFPISQHSPTDWGWFTVFNFSSTSNRYFVDMLKFPPPINSTDMSFCSFTLSEIKDENLLKNNFSKLLHFLETDDNNFARVKKARESINANLEKWLDEGWLTATKEDVYYKTKLDKPPRTLKKGELFINNRIYKFEHFKLIDKLSKNILDLQNR